MTFLELPSGDFINADQISDVQSRSSLLLVYFVAPQGSLRSYRDEGSSAVLRKTALSDARCLKLDATDSAALQTWLDANSTTL